MYVRLNTMYLNILLHNDIEGVSKLKGLLLKVTDYNCNI